MKKQLKMYIADIVAMIITAAVFIYPNEAAKLVPFDSSYFLMLENPKYSSLSFFDLTADMLSAFKNERKETFNASTPQEEESKTRVINNVEEKTSLSKGNMSYNNVKIMNSSGKNVDISALMTGYVPIKDRKNFKILIIHSHGTESYLDVSDSRTNDTSKNMIAVGERLKQDLVKKGFNVLHDVKMHDLPDYNKSYPNSLKTLNWYMATYSDIGIIIDLHRDAIETADKKAVKLVYEKDGKKYAQLMAVVGSNGGGLEHNTYFENLKFAVALQESAENLYPGLFRPIDFRKERFNQHILNNCIIIEDGTHGNTLNEALESMDLFSDVLDKLVK